MTYGVVNPDPVIGTNKR